MLINAIRSEINISTYLIVINVFIKFISLLFKKGGYVGLCEKEIFLK